MPIIVTMDASHESDVPSNGSGSGTTPERDPMPPGPGSFQDGITRERLTNVIRRLESGFYDTTEIRDHVARRVREELAP
jgi:hypothetical protein